MKEVLTSFIVLSVVGTILHFTYDLSKKNIIVGVFSSVNESIWEHIKILITPILIYNTVKYVCGYQNNYFLALFMQLLIAILGIYYFYKLKVRIFKNKKDYLNILIFYIVSFMCSLAQNYIKNFPEYNILNVVSLFGTIIIFIMYMTFTICPPKKDMFKDQITGKYGITCVNK